MKDVFENMSLKPMEIYCANYFLRLFQLARIQFPELLSLKSMGPFKANPYK